ncbi:arabinosyltransferase AftC [Gordonia hirsuta DSM 44140 = NBRC 16056]|uniref:Arabinosyltransferase AftC n=1 Tax=Gordonia hirsuta DSM 44140 = NBRC 16056 TaxID=1121927 RepID=L7L8X6_9ACTN|nr:glycosyltransferase family 87 protein [Gordonia hirsuta]GAC57389.1 arabinosyltransferase AftC [Gordonia hirsuta DSM 44140 = NBRC 16056]
MNVIDRYLYPRVDPARIVSVILWPISILMIFHRSVFLAVNGARTDDFTTVYNASLNFLNRNPVYAENYTTVDPHYLYPPSGTLLMGPLAILNPQDSRWLFIAVSVVVLILCAYLLVRMFGYRADSWVFPAVLFFFFATETVANTLIFTNFNAFVLLGMLAFLMLMRGRYDLWAGVAIGLTLAVKPVLAPLLLLPLLQLRWKVLFTAIGIPVVLNIAAWPLIVDSKDFISRTVPYLMDTRDYYNSSISGNGLYFGIDTWLIWVLRIAFAVMAVFSLWFLYRYYSQTDELLWLATSSGILLGTLFLVGSLGQGYYSMLLFPMLMTVFLPGSVMRNWPAWLAVYGCMTFDVFVSVQWRPFARYLEYNKVPLGWSLLMITAFCVLLFRWLDIRAAHKDDGLPRGENTPVPA